MRNKKIATSFVIILFLLLSLSVAIATPVKNTDESEVIIKVAIYDSFSFRSPKKIAEALNYSWEYNGTTYKFQTSLIGDKEIIGFGKNKLNNENYDVFMMGAVMRQFIINIRLLFSHDREYLGLRDSRWIKNVREFVANGGGYIGYCGGTNIATQGLEVRPDKASIWDTLSLKIIHLGIANVYSNDQQTEEWQYAWKISMRRNEGEIGVPLNISINNSHPIFNGYPYPTRNILWFAGPALVDGKANDEKLGEIIPLAYYTEEPMEKAPLHMYRFNKPYSEIKTDIKGQYAAIATSYNDSGRVVLYGPHPEFSPFTGGEFSEYKGPIRFPLYDNYYYSWTNVNQEPDDYNYWIIRRSAAWAYYLPDEAFPAFEYVD